MILLDPNADVDGEYQDSDDGCATLACAYVRACAVKKFSPFLHVHVDGDHRDHACDYVRGIHVRACADGVP